MPEIITQRSYYLAATDDEINPVQGTLEECAATLAAGLPAEELDPDGMPPAVDGSRHRFLWTDWSYVPCPRAPGGSYAIPEVLPGRVHAVAFGPRLGWTSVTMIGPTDAMFRRLCREDVSQAERDADLRQSARAMLAEIGDEPVEWLACETGSGDVMLTFRAGRLVEEPLHG